jgi:hypothetical protein
MVDGPPQPANDDDTKAQQRSRLVWTLVGAGVLVLGLLLACVLFFPKWLYPDLTDNDLRDVKAAQNESDAAKKRELKDARLKLQNDARTSLLQGLGPVLLLTGAAFAASMTYRQVQATREQIRETATASRNQLQLSERGQVTDRYTKAVEQLGHEKAPVRLGALYSLERLAQDNPEYRQTVVDVFCAYLRMPYPFTAQTEPDAEQGKETAPPANGRDQTPHSAPGREHAREELEVRQTAQRLLADHLRCPPGTSGQDAQLLPPSPQHAFWPGISLDLSGATLINSSFERVSVKQVKFVGATFLGSWFSAATFQGDASFVAATFRDAAFFNDATFQRMALFNSATFQDTAFFLGATFQGTAWFDDATFQGTVRFDDESFQGTAGFERAHVVALDGLDRDRVWPDGWTVRPDPADPTRGTLVRAEHAKEPEPAVPPSDPTDSGSGTG